MFRLSFAVIKKLQIQSWCIKIQHCIYQQITYAHANYLKHRVNGGTAVAVLQIERSLIRSQLVSLEIFVDIKSFRSHYDHGVDSASNRNEYQEHFLGVKSGRCVRLTTLPPSYAVVMKSGNRNFLEPSGPLQACNETACLLYGDNGRQRSKHVAN